MADRNSDIVVADFDPEGFAKWLSDAYQNSRFKSMTRVGSLIGSNKATMSRIMNASPQSLTGKPTRLKPSMVKKLGTLLGADVAEGLRLAGFPVYDKDSEPPKNLPELIEALDRLGIEIEWATVNGNFDNYTPDDFEELKEQIAAAVGVKLKRIARR